MTVNVDRQFYWHNPETREKLKVLAEIGFSTRTLNCFANEGLWDVDAICERSAQELLKIPNFGRSSLNEVIAGLASMGRALRGDDDVGDALLAELIARANETRKALKDATTAHKQAMLNVEQRREQLFGLTSRHR